MLTVQPITAMHFAAALQPNADVSPLVAPPFDVQDDQSKARLLGRDPHNIVAVDLPHLPAKTVGPDSAYEQAGRLFAQWQQEGVLARAKAPAFLAYRQTITLRGQERVRSGLFAGVSLQPFGQAPDGPGGVWPHELTLREGTIDRLKLMRTTDAQLSPVFSLYRDDQDEVTTLLDAWMEAWPVSFTAVTDHDGCRHEVWIMDQPAIRQRLQKALAGADIFIADGHHRYTTALAYQQERMEAARASGKEWPADHPANRCLMVLVAANDPGLEILPTHRVLGGMTGFTLAKFAAAAGKRLRVNPFPGRDLAALEAALPSAGAHAIGLYDPSRPRDPLAIATTPESDPLVRLQPTRSPTWRSLDVAITQHLVVEAICQPSFCPSSQPVQWKYPHTLTELVQLCDGGAFQLGLVLQPTPLEAVLAVSRGGEVMPAKSTFFHPKLATGLVIYPMDQ